MLQTPPLCVYCLWCVIIQLSIGDNVFTLNEVQQPGNQESRCGGDDMRYYGGCSYAQSIPNADGRRIYAPAGGQGFASAS